MIDISLLNIYFLLFLSLFLFLFITFKYNNLINNTININRINFIIVETILFSIIGPKILFKLLVEIKFIVVSNFLPL